MKLVVFGLAVSSSWGNGHATLWRGLIRALAARGHRVVFFEQDVPYYALNRDLHAIPGGDLVLYPDWDSASLRAKTELRDADVALVTSYCPHGLEATSLVLDAPRPVRVFYDLDTPVTLSRLEAGETTTYIGPHALSPFDLVLSYTGGRALDALRDGLGARRVLPLYGHVDPDVHRPAPPQDHYRADLSYLGTYAADRQAALEALFIEPARVRPQSRFLIGGAQYPPDFPWTPNVFFVRHLPPSEHPAFFSSSRLTLNVTRQAMAAMGWCPSGRLFEAAACGTPLLTDAWEGLEAFFTPGREILLARTTADTAAALDLSDAELARMARDARERTLAEHSSARRADELVAAIETAASLSSPQGGGERGGDRCGREDLTMWGIVPAAGRGSRIQPLAFSKELLPVGSRLDGGVERPCAVSEYLVERMIRGGAEKICFVISPGKSDIMEYYGAGYGDASVAYVVQPRPSGLCDAIFRALPLLAPDEPVIVGLPDTIWFPADALLGLPDDRLSFLLFPVERPEFFDAVVLDEGGRVREIQVKEAEARSRWIWGAFKMPGRVLADLRRLWEERERADEYIGTLANAYLARGGEAWGVAAGQSYVDVGTLNGYRAALKLLSEAADADSGGRGRVALGWPAGRALQDASGDRGREKA